eukprot:Platyproteum_vivax@DN8394_c0_g1_i1.p1
MGGQSGKVQDDVETTNKVASEDQQVAELQMTFIHRITFVLDVTLLVLNIGLLIGAIVTGMRGPIWAFALFTIYQGIRVGLMFRARHFIWHFAGLFTTAVFFTLICAYTGVYGTYTNFHFGRSFVCLPEGMSKFSAYFFLLWCIIHILLSGSTLALSIHMRELDAAIMVSRSSESMDETKLPTQLDNAFANQAGYA